MVDAPRRRSAEATGLYQNDQRDYDPKIGSTFQFNPVGLVIIHLPIEWIRRGQFTHWSLWNGSRWILTAIDFWRIVENGGGLSFAEACRFRIRIHLEFCQDGSLNNFFNRADGHTDWQSMKMTNCRQAANRFSKCRHAWRESFIAADLQSVVLTEKSRICSKHYVQS